MIGQFSQIIGKVNYPGTVIQEKVVNYFNDLSTSNAFFYIKIIYCICDVACHFLNFECQKHNTMIVLLKTNDLSLCLNREYSKSVLQKNN